MFSAAKNRDDVVLLVVVQKQVYKDTLLGNSCTASREGRLPNTLNVHASDIQGAIAKSKSAILASDAA